MGVNKRVCVKSVGIFGHKSGITRRILGVLGRMRAGCVGVEVEHLFQRKRLGIRRLPEFLETSRTLKKKSFLPCPPFFLVLFDHNRIKAVPRVCLSGVLW